MILAILFISLDTFQVMVGWFFQTSMYFSFCYGNIAETYISDRICNENITHPPISWITGITSIVINAFHYRSYSSIFFFSYIIRFCQKKKKKSCVWGSPTDPKFLCWSYNIFCSIWQRNFMKRAISALHSAKNRLKIHQLQPELFLFKEK